MNKIPLETTIGSAYRFFFTRILSVLGTLWLPMLIMVALIAGVAYTVVPHDWWQGNFPTLDDKHPNPAELWAVFHPFVIGMPPLMLVSWVLGSMMMVGLMQLSLGQKERCYIFFSLGADVWRLILAQILMFVIVMVNLMLSVGVAVAVGVLGKSLLPHAAWIATTVVVSIAAFCWCVYMPVRLCFFLPGVVVAEHRVGLGRSWALGGGNFWRIVLIFLMILIPVFIVAGIIQNLTVMPIMASQLTQLLHTGKPNPADVAVFIRALPPLIPAFVAIGLLERIAISGLMAGAIGTAYNAVQPTKEESTAA
jgi:hypothetical protein